MIGYSKPFVLVVSVMQLLLIVTVEATAHPLSISSSRFSVGQEAVEAIYRLPLDDMDLLLRLDQDLDGAVTPGELETAQDEISAYLAAWIVLTTDGSALTANLQGTSIWRDSSDFSYLESRVRYTARNAIEDLQVSVRVLTHLYPDHINLAEFVIGPDREEYVFQHGNTWSGKSGMTSGWRTAREFTLLGIEHIITGYDHLLFLLGLLLVGRGIRNLIAIVTSFTVAHSLTLALATLGLVQPAGWIIEAAIALSIAYVGLENLLVKEVRHRWRLSFGFGLVHGFGFAGILQQMDLARGGLLLSLFTFNLGVEVGQLVIVALFWPLLQQLSRSQYRVAVVRSASTVVLVFGVLWFLERVA